MSLLQAVILGALQGLTEFVPVSSTAHLYLAQAWMGIRNDELALSFDIVLHLGTVLALVVALRVERIRSVGLIGASMLVACAYFFAAEALSARRSRPARPLSDLDNRDGIWIGMAQAAAGLMAGFSRSGFTIATGKLRGFRREDAARFSFLLALPIILGAGAKALLDLRKAVGPSVGGAELAAGFAAAAVVGYVAIEGLLRFLRTHSLRPFAVYLGLLGLLLLGGTFLPGRLPFLPR